VTIAVGTDTSACDAATTGLDVDSDEQAARDAIATDAINPVTVVSNSLRIFILMPPIWVVVIHQVGSSKPHQTRGVNLSAELF
jgi:hypothetical protein